MVLIAASGDFCLINDAAGKRHTISQNLGSIHQQLNPKKKIKINRSEIINIYFIEKIESPFKNRLLISIKNYKEKVMNSSSTTAEFRKWLEK
jgi:two-component system response regulator LytT